MSLVIGLMHVKNEADIVEETIRYYFSQGVRLIVIDDYSDDSTYELCEGLIHKGILLELHKTSISGQGLGFRNPTLNKFQNPFLTSRNSRDNLMIQEAFHYATKYDPVWVLVCDADCFLESRDHKTLSEGLLQLQEQGYNAVEFYRINFFPTLEDNMMLKNVRERILYYVPFPAAPLDWSRHCGLFHPDMYIGKHHVEFPNMMLNIPNRPWIYRHYPYRSFKQAKEKVLSSNDYQFGSRSSSWQSLLKDESSFYEITDMMLRREEGMGWQLRFDLFEKDKLRSDNNHNAHDYIQKHWPTYPK